MTKEYMKQKTTLDHIILYYALCVCVCRVYIYIPSMHGFNIRLLSKIHRRGLKEVAETNFVPLRVSRMRAGLEVGLVTQ